jgi:hypothetical protein
MFSEDNSMRGHIVVTLHPCFKDFMFSEDNSDKIVDILQFDYESHCGLFSNDYTINISINNIVIISSKYSLKKYDFFIFMTDIYKKILHCDNLLVNKQQLLVDVATKGIYSIFKLKSQKIINFKHIYNKISNPHFSLHPIIMICLILRMIETNEMNFHI